MTQSGIPPAYDQSWRNDAQAAADAAAVLRIPTVGADAERLKVCAKAAGFHISTFLDRTEPIPGIVAGDPPEDLRFAHAQVTVELFRRKDAPFGVLDAWSPDTGVARIGTDPLAGVKNMILPYRARWGIG